MAACHRRHEGRRHPGGSAPLPEGVAAWVRHSCALEKRAAQYGFQVDGAFTDGNDRDLCQCRGRGAAEYRGQNVDVILPVWKVVDQRSIVDSPNGITEWLGKNITIVNAIISLILGLFGGAIGSLIAPWVHWRIEKKKL